MTLSRLVLTSLLLSARGRRQILRKSGFDYKRIQAYGGYWEEYSDKKKRYVMDRRYLAEVEPGPEPVPQHDPITWT